MVVDTDKIPAEILRMSELEFSEFFGELVCYIEKQKWSHLTKPLTEDLDNEILDLTNQLDNSSDEETQLRSELRERDKSIMNFKNELEVLLHKL